jgi:hypothetical protein
LVPEAPVPVDATPVELPSLDPLLSSDGGLPVLPVVPPVEPSASPDDPEPEPLDDAPESEPDAPELAAGPPDSTTPPREQSPADCSHFASLVSWQQPSVWHV